MKNVEFYNNKIKEEYQNIISHHYGLAHIILSLIKDNGEIKIMAIEDDLDVKNMYIMANDELITIKLDFLKKKLYLKQNETFSEIYDINAKKNVMPTGYLYENDARSITKVILSKLTSTIGKIKYYEIKENNNQCFVIINDINSMINENELIQNLLDSNNQLDNIRNVFLTITNLIDTRNIDIKLSDAKGSCIVISNGEVLNYLEYQEQGKDYQKIFLKNGEFYVEKKVVGEYRDEVTSYVKKLGVRNGKEKR